MQTRWILLTLVCVSLLVVGQILFKRAAAQWHVEGMSWTTVTTFFSPALISAVALYGFTTILWVFVLRNVPLVLAMPLNALAFIATPVAAHFLLDEPLTANTLVGGIVIVIGVAIAVR